MSGMQDIPPCGFEIGNDLDGGEGGGFSLHGFCVVNFGKNGRKAWLSTETKKKERGEINTLYQLH